MKTLAKATLKVVDKLEDKSRPSVSYLKAHWEELSQGAGGVPVRVQYHKPKGAVLTLACGDFEGLRLRHEAPQLLKTINKNLAEEVFTRLNVIKKRPNK